MSQPVLPRPALALLCLLALAACDPKADDTARPDGGDDTGASSGDDTGTETDTDTSPDGDSDGFTINDGDCDDEDAAVYPGAVEVCDGLDNNCDDQIDEDLDVTWYADTDRDGFGDPDTTAVACEAPTHYTDDSRDCDDTNALIYPGAAEVCDTSGADEDCDGLVNDDDSSVTGTTAFYADRDGDGFGSAATATRSCAQPSGYVDNDLDCSDSRFDKADPSEGCWSGTWGGTFTFAFVFTDLSFSDGCSGTASLPVDLDASPMLDTTISCTTATIGDLNIDITGNIDADGVVTGDLDTGYIATTWDGDITKDVLSGSASGTGTALGLNVSYTFRISATP